jgi:hypothetical protein
MKINTHFRTYLALFFPEWEIFQTEVVQKIKHILCSITFCKSCRLCNNVEKYGTAGQGTYDNMVHLHCTLDT